MIETNDVKILSVSVTIKALKLNNRQMTQAVFNQLQIADGLISPYDEDGELRTPFEIDGKVWGWVNYKPDEVWLVKATKGWLAIRHFLVVRGETLYRAHALRDWMSNDGPFPNDDKHIVEEMGAKRYADAMNDARVRLLKFPQLFIAV